MWPHCITNQCTFSILFRYRYTELNDLEDKGEYFDVVLLKEMAYYDENIFEENDAKNGWKKLNDMSQDRFYVLLSSFKSIWKHVACDNKNQWYILPELRKESEFPYTHLKYYGSNGE